MSQSKCLANEGTHIKLPKDSLSRRCVINVSWINNSSQRSHIFYPLKKTPHFKLNIILVYSIFFSRFFSRTNEETSQRNYREQGIIIYDYSAHNIYIEISKQVYHTIQAVSKGVETARDLAHRKPWLLPLLWCHDERCTHTWRTGVFQSLWSSSAWSRKRARVDIAVSGANTPAHYARGFSATRFIVRVMLRLL